MYTYIYVHIYIIYTYIYIYLYIYLQIMGQRTYELVQNFFHQQYQCISHSSR